MKRNNLCYSPTLMREVSTFVYDSTPPWANDPFFRRGYSADDVGRARRSRPPGEVQGEPGVRAGAEVQGRTRGGESQPQARVRRRHPRRLRHRHRSGRALPGLLRAPRTRDDGGLGPHADAGDRRRPPATPPRAGASRARSAPSPPALRPISSCSPATRSTTSRTRARSTPSTSAGGRSRRRRHSRSAHASPDAEQRRHVGHRRAQMGVRRGGERRPVVRARPHADVPAHAGVGAGLQIERGVADVGDARAPRATPVASIARKIEIRRRPPGGHVVAAHDDVGDLAPAEQRRAGASVSARSNPVLSATRTPAARSVGHHVGGARQLGRPSPACRRRSNRAGTARRRARRARAWSGAVGQQLRERQPLGGAAHRLDLARR